MHDGALSDRAKQDPKGFEVACAESLRRLGWVARTTAASGDQGVDVVATKDGVKAVLQCKLHSKPAGNKAVQEIIAGRDYEKANVAAVVASAGFTRSAYELAAATGVLLLRIEDLSQIDLASRRVRSAA